MSARARETLAQRRTEVASRIESLEEQRRQVNADLSAELAVLCGRLSEIDFALTLSTDDPAAKERRRSKRNISEIVRSSLAGAELDIAGILQRVNTHLAKPDRISRRSVVRALDRDTQIQKTPIGYRLVAPVPAEAVHGVLAPQPAEPEP
jgi:hypothetical protein